MDEKSDRFGIAEKTREKGDPRAARALFTQSCLTYRTRFYLW